MTVILLDIQLLFYFSVIDLSIKFRFNFALNISYLFIFIILWVDLGYLTLACVLVCTY